MRMNKPHTTIWSITNMMFNKNGNSCLSPCIKINLKWIKYLNISPEILKLLEESMGKTLEDIG